MLLLESGAEYSVLPVCTDAKYRRIGEIGILLGHAVGNKIIIVLRIFTKIQNVKSLGLMVDSKHAVVSELGFAGLTALGGYKNDTVGALRTVNGCSGGILKNLHRHDVGGVDCRKRRYGRGATVTESIAETEACTRVAGALYNNTVNNVKRLGVGIDSSLTAHTYGR